MASFIRFNNSDPLSTVVAKLNTNFANVSKAIEDSIRKLKSSIPDIPELADVATSGDYNDLSNRPSIPSLSWTLLKHENTSGSSTMANSIVDFSGCTEVLAISGMATGNGLALIPIVACGDTDWAQFKTSTSKLIKIRLHPTNPAYPTLAVDGGADWYIYGR